MRSNYLFSRSGTNLWGRTSSCLSRIFFLKSNRLFTSSRVLFEATLSFVMARELSWDQTVSVKADEFFSDPYRVSFSFKKILGTLEHVPFCSQPLNRDSRSLLALEKNLVPLRNLFWFRRAWGLFFGLFKLQKKENWNLLRVSLRSYTSWILSSLPWLEK